MTTFTYILGQTTFVVTSTVKINDVADWDAHCMCYSSYNLDINDKL